MKTVIIIGAGGHGKVVADSIQKSGDQVIGFLDDNPEPSKMFAGFPILGSVEDYTAYKDRAEFVIAIGNAKVREEIAKEMESVDWYTAIHPSAEIAEIEVIIGEGSVIMANAIINAGSKIGRHCIINSGAVVEHDNVLEDFVHVSVGARLAETTHIGRRTWIGIGSSISNNIAICEDCIIGAGAVVIESIRQSGTYVGVPAEKVKHTRE